jgi:hypothetical protein
MMVSFCPHCMNIKCCDKCFKLFSCMSCRTHYFQIRSDFYFKELTGEDNRDNLWEKLMKINRKIVLRPLWNYPAPILVNSFKVVRFVMFLYVIALRTSIQLQKRISVYLEFWSLHTVYFYM